VEGKTGERRYLDSRGHIARKPKVQFAMHERENMHSNKPESALLAELFNRGVQPAPG
jgi:hypothetical protein